MTEKQKQYHRVYRAKHLSKIQTYNHEYQKRYRKKYLGNSENKTRAKEYAKEYRKKNRERIKAYQKVWRKKHNIPLKKAWREKIVEKYGAYCRECKATQNLTLQHIVPQCIGGKYSYENLEILCLKCNIRNYHKLVKLALKFYFEHKDTL